MQRPLTNHGSSAGYSLLELVTTLAVLAILVVGTIPIAENAVKREKEMRLREDLRMMRNAIDEFKRDTYGSLPAGSGGERQPDGSRTGRRRSG